MGGRGKPKPGKEKELYEELLDKIRRKRARRGRGTLTVRAFQERQREVIRTFNFPGDEEAYASYLYRQRTGEDYPDPDEAAEQLSLEADLDQVISLDGEGEDRLGAPESGESDPQALLLDLATYEALASSLPARPIDKAPAEESLPLARLSVSKQSIVENFYVEDGHFQVSYQLVTYDDDSMGLEALDVNQVKPGYKLRDEEIAKFKRTDEATRRRFEEFQELYVLQQARDLHRTYQHGDEPLDPADDPPLPQPGEKLPYSLVKKGEPTGGLHYYYLEKAAQGRDYSMITYDPDATLPDGTPVGRYLVHPAHRNHMRHPTATLVNDSGVHEIYVDGMTFEEFLDATGLESDPTRKGGFVLVKRESRLLRGYFFDVELPSEEVRITHLDMSENPELALVWDGAGVISRDFLMRMQLAGVTDPIQRDALIAELAHARRVEFTIQGPNGQEKGHAIVAESIPVYEPGKLQEYRRKMAEAQARGLSEGDLRARRKELRAELDQHITHYRHPLRRPTPGNGAAYEALAAELREVKRDRGYHMQAQIADLEARMEALSETYDFVLPPDAKRELRQTDGTTFVGINIVHGQAHMRIDEQSLVNLMPFFNRENLGEWLQDDAEVFLEGLRTGNIAEPLRRLRENLRPEDLKRWILSYYAAAQADIRYFRTFGSQLLRQFQQRIYTAEEKFRLAMPGCRQYIIPAGVVQAAGHPVTVAPGKVRITPGFSSIICNDRDWVALGDALEYRYSADQRAALFARRGELRARYVELRKHYAQHAHELMAEQFQDRAITPRQMERMISRAAADALRQELPRKAEAINTRPALEANLALHLRNLGWSEQAIDEHLDAISAKGIRDIGGGADNDDAYWIHCFVDHDDKRKALLWRSPNAEGEWVVLELTEDSWIPEWRKADGSIAPLPRNDSRKLTTRIDARARQRNLKYIENMILPDDKQLWEGMSYQEAMAQTHVRMKKLKGVLGKYCNFLEVLTAIGYRPRELPAPLEKVIDNTVKLGGDLSRVARWIDDNLRKLALYTHTNPRFKIPLVLGHRWNVRWPPGAERIEPLWTRDHPLQEIQDMTDGILQMTHQRGEAIIAEHFRLPNAVVQSVVSRPDFKSLLARGSMLNQISGRGRKQAKRSGKAVADEPPLEDVPDDSFSLSRHLGQASGQGGRSRNSEIDNEVYTAQLNYLLAVPDEGERLAIIRAAMLSAQLNNSGDGSFWMKGPIGPDGLQDTRLPEMALKALHEVGVAQDYEMKEGRVQLKPAPVMTPSRTIETGAIQGMWINEHNLRCAAEGRADLICNLPGEFRERNLGEHEQAAKQLVADKAQQPVEEGGYLGMRLTVQEQPLWVQISRPEAAQPRSEIRRGQAKPPRQKQPKERRQELRRVFVDQQGHMRGMVPQNDLTLKPGDTVLVTDATADNGNIQFFFSREEAPHSDRTIQSQTDSNSPDDFDYDALIGALTGDSADTK